MPAPSLDTTQLDSEGLLLALCDARAECRLISDRIVAMREADPPNGTRQSGLDWLQRRLNALAKRCGGAAGYDDPTDPFADEAFTALQEEISELSAFGAPYPLGPLTAEPFAMDPPRLHNGKLL